MGPLRPLDPDRNGTLSVRTTLSKPMRNRDLAPWFSLLADEEAGHYRVLAYVHRIDGRYRERKLYPYLDELRAGAEELLSLRQEREQLASAMPRPIIGMDLLKGRLLRATVREDDILRAIDGMIANTLPELDRVMERGRQLREQLTAGIRFEPVGLLPLYTNEGYLILHHGREARSYAYSLGLPMPDTEGSEHRVLRTRFVADHTIGITCTYEQVKADLVRNHPGLPNPAVFAFVSDVSLPIIETFVPLAKQLVYEMVAGQVA